MQAVGRWGNFFNQELYGPPTNLPWGIAIDCAHRVAAVPVRAYPVDDDVLPPAVPVRVDQRRRRRRHAALDRAPVGRAAAAGRPVPHLPHLVRRRPVPARDAADRQLDVLRDPDRDGRLGVVIVGRVVVLRSGTGRAPVDERWGDPPQRDEARRDDDEAIDDDGRRAEAEPTTSGRRGEPSDADDDDDRRRRGDRDGDRDGGGDAARPAPGRLTRPAGAPGRAADGRAAPRRRPPPSRLSPEALRRRAGGAGEGLAWLGREPEAQASLLYRVLRLVARFVLFGAVPLPDRDERARSGCPRRAATCSIGAAHRGWMDPFVVMHALPDRAARLVPRQRPVDVHRRAGGSG